MDIFLLYLFTRLDGAVFVAQLFSISGGIATLILWIIYGVARMDNEDAAATKAHAGAVRATWIFIPALLALVLVPTQKDAALILGGSAVLEAARSETAGRLASKSVQLIEQTLDGYLKPDAERKAAGK